jgi:hypothetical protein
MNFSIYPRSGNFAENVTLVFELKIVRPLHYTFSHRAILVNAKIANFTNEFHFNRNLSIFASLTHTNSLSMLTQLQFCCVAEHR